MLTDGNEREDSVSRIDNISGLGLQKGENYDQMRYIDSEGLRDEDMSMLAELKLDEI